MHYLSTTNTRSLRPYTAPTPPKHLDGSIMTTSNSMKRILRITSNHIMDEESPVGYDTE